MQVEKDLPADKFTHIAFSYDGSSKGAGVEVYINGMRAKTKIQIDHLDATIKTNVPFSIGRRGGMAVPFHGSVADVRVYPRVLGADEIASLGGAPVLETVKIPVEKRSAKQKDDLREFFRTNVATDYIAVEKKLEESRKEKTAEEKNAPNTMVMVEMDKPRDTFIKIRGQYDKNGDKVTANTPHFLPPLPEHAINGKRYTRLDLARWLMSPDQPLVARVEVNRLWAMVFGTGIVKTVNDFGSQGEWPSHPELLDWLAADFMQDWDIKRAVRQMVVSSTYRQASTFSPELRERDSGNRLLARGPRSRLEAEFIRDNALAIGGLLNDAIGGKPVFPAQPPGIWEVNELGGGGWKQQHDSGQYRRGIYVYQRRSTPYPSLLAFDAPSREVCTAQRSHSDTPLQSLVLMNDPVYVEAARALAQRVLKEAGGETSARLELMWRLALSRKLEPEQREILEKAIDRELDHFHNDKTAAEKLSKVGDLPMPKDIDVEELAAWTSVANVILNLNETISD